MKILCIPDLHCPFNHIDSFAFVKTVNDFFGPDKIIFLGDEIDGHSISFHDKDPDLFSPSQELEKAIERLIPFYELFPKATILESNHGSLVYRKGKFHGLPRNVFKSYREILQAPKGWKWVYDLVLKSNGRDIYFHHGQRRDSLSNSKSHSMCYVQGHHHTNFEIRYWANKRDIYWGATSGCLIDHKQLAFTYAKTYALKPLLGCTIIDSGIPYLIPMILNKDGRWVGNINLK